MAGKLFDAAKATTSPNAEASQPFAFECPISVFKADDAADGKQRRVAGIISTENPDRQREVILQDGLDFGDFINHGWFNDNHKDSMDAVLGYPETVSTFKRGEKLPDGSKAPTDCTWVEGYLLNTEKAEKVWELAQALQSTHRRLGYSVEGSIEKRSGVGDRTIAKAKIRNVAITHCFPGDTRVSGSAEAITRRMYSGKMVTVALATGHKLTGTPNHPVLTQRGWIGLGALNEADDRIGCRLGDRLSSTAPTVGEDVDNVPATFDEAFDAALDNGGQNGRHVGAVPQFHGDGSNGDVDVVLVEGLLQNAFAAQFTQQFGQDALPASDKLLALLAGLRNGSSVAGCRPFPFPADGGGLGKGAFLFGSSQGVAASVFLNDGARNSVVGHDFVHALPAYAVGGSQGAARFAGYVPANHVGLSGSVELDELRDGRAHPPSSAHHRDAADAVTGGDAGRRLSGAISFSDIVSKTVSDYCGHVYNLDTRHGWYDANGIIAHNCPVNTDARLEILARSLSAIASQEAAKAMSMGTGVPGPDVAQPDKPYTGAGAGRVLAREDLDQETYGPNQRKRRRRAKKSAPEGQLTEAEALRIIKSFGADISTQTARQFLAAAEIFAQLGIV